MITRTLESHLRIKMPRTRSLHVRGMLFSIGLAGCEQTVIGDIGPCGAEETLCGTVCVDEQTDLNHCGNCGVTCNGTCALGRCLVTLASEQDTPDFIAVDSMSVYWTNENGGTVMKLPIGGGAAITLASGQNEPEFIAVDGTNVYWTTLTDLTVMKVSLGGGTPTTLFSGQKTALLPGQETTPPALGIAVSSSSLYWTTRDDEVIKTPVGGGQSSVFVSIPYPTGFAGSQGIAADATSLYWVSARFCSGQPQTCSGLVLKVPLSGGTVQTLAQDQGFPESIAVDSTRVYWTDSLTETLMDLPKGGGTPMTLASGQPEPDFIAVDGMNVYWTTGAGGTVMKVPVGGGAATTLASGQQNPLGIAVDDTSVYWTNSKGQSVIRLSPK